MLTYAKIVGLRREKRADTDGCRRAVTGKIYIAQSVYSGGVDFYAGVQPDGCRCPAGWMPVSPAGDTQCLRAKC